MRRFCLLALLLSSCVSAETLLKVEPNSVLRLPATTSTLLLNRLEVADHATLLLPASLNELRVDELRLGRDAHIGIAPSQQPFRLEVKRGQLAAGSHISARGSAGTAKLAAMPGRNLTLRFAQVEVSDLGLDVRGGAGAAGHRGADGQSGEPGGCVWGQATRGADGQPGADGQSGAAGGQVRFEVAPDFVTEVVKFSALGGPGGEPGAGGSGGAGGAVNNCLLYDAAGAAGGRPGAAGKPGAPGPAGSITWVRLAE